MFRLSINKQKKREKKTYFLNWKNYIGIHGSYKFIQFFQFASVPIRQIGYIKNFFLSNKNNKKTKRLQLIALYASDELSVRVTAHNDAHTVFVNFKISNVFFHSYSSHWLYGELFLFFQSTKKRTCGCCCAAAKRKNHFISDDVMWRRRPNSENENCRIGEAKFFFTFIGVRFIQLNHFPRP